MTFPILYEDDEILAVDKPREIHVHPTKMSKGEASVQSILEEQRGCRLLRQPSLLGRAGGEALT
jgi:23S rRNA-/tRNA-specific pseudouridylate synthase